MIDGMEVSILSHVTNAALVVYTLKWLRGTKRYQRFAEWLPCENAKVHRAMSFLGAIASAGGMHGSIEGHAGIGWHLAADIPPLWVILHSSWDVIQQMMLNQVVFALAEKEKSAAPVVTVPVPDTKDITVTAAIPKESGV